MEELRNQVKELFEYRDGGLYWKKSCGSAGKGRRAGNINSWGYRRILINRKMHKEHRLIFLLFHGYLPPMLDHINGDRADNRIENLRECTASQNLQNKAMHKNNKTGVKNVYWCGRAKRYVVSVICSGTRFVKLCKTLEEAAKIAEKKRNELHKEFSRHS
jgi:HNH endonuclease